MHEFPVNIKAIIRHLIRYVLGIFMTLIDNPGIILSLKIEIYRWKNLFTNKKQIILSFL
jgi:hypothetical protein